MPTSIYLYVHVSTMWKYGPLQYVGLSHHTPQQPLIHVV